MKTVEDCRTQEKLPFGSADDPRSTKDGTELGAQRAKEITPGVYGWESRCRA